MDAADLRREEVEIGKGILGEEHLSYLVSLGNLVLILDEQGKSEEAEKLGVQINYDGDKKKDHPETLTSMGNLAGTWGILGCYKEVAKRMEYCLALRKRVLGIDLPRRSLRCLR
ncbi:hypothetical protein HYALB_00001137 [Hymenoscyphus albidus]|uniref:Uncharacterized protein n=1 Tax=Hymenoscyphus albidus TaxID=595503 RepID=A0A9N9PRH5_9HELO|nr:hypothetical protein HYALB_00001137 [Hymenoscyphus albidus]